MIVFASYSSERNVADDIDLATPYPNLQERERPLLWLTYLR